MKRRNLLTASAAAAAVGFAGCSAFSDDNTDALESQLEAQNQTISDLREQRSDLEEELNETEQERNEFEQRVTELEQEIEAAEGDISELEEERESLIVNRIVTLYESAEKFYDIAEESFSQGSNSIEDGSTAGDVGALNRFREAYGQYDAATELTFLAGQLADEEGYSNASELATESNSYVINMRAACGDYLVAAQNFLLDNTEDGNQNLSDGGADFDNAAQYTFTSSRAFENSISTTTDTSA